MFNVGDRVVYPLHGAGIIKSIEKKKISNSEKEYYALTIPFRKLEVLIPVENGESLGLRGVVEWRKIDEIEKILNSDAFCDETNWNRRYRDNLELLKTGDILDVAKVVRNLYKLDFKKPLATGEKKMLSNAKSILASELAMINNKTEEETIIWIKKLILKNQI